MIHPELLEILCCPETHQPVREASAPLLDRVNRAVRAGGLKAENDLEIGEPLAGGLVREDGKFLYPVRNGIPIMLIEERIPVPPAISPPAADAEPGRESAAVTAPGGSHEDVEQDRDAGHHQVQAGPRS